jgi:DnaK suppressor protein
MKGSGDDARRRVKRAGARLERLRGQIMQELGQSPKRWSQELSSYDNHPADEATTTFHRELDAGLAQGLSERLREVDRALAKIDEGTYGQCDRCGRPIARDRLQARPESTECRECAEDRERWIPADTRRPLAPLLRGTSEPVPADFWNTVAAWGNSDTPQDRPPAVGYEEPLDEDRPQGAVEAIEGYLDETGEPLWDTLRGRARRQSRSTERASEDIPPDGDGR